MIVMKFGGSSLADRQCLANVTQLMKKFDGPKALVVSALGKSTDCLLEMGRCAESGVDSAVQSLFRELRRHHRESCPEPDLIPSAHTDLFDELSSLLQGITLLHEQTPRSRALLASFGERLSVHVVVAHLRTVGLQAKAVDARQFVSTNENFQTARVDFERTAERGRELLLPLLQQGLIPVITGFLGASENGLTTTLGRGGSDYTATIIGQVLEAREVWIWTDVSGILSADPRLVKNTHTLPQVSYREASEMSFFGARVLHPKTILPAIRSQIPVRILNTFQPDHKGTLITHETPKSLGGVKTVASIHDLAMVTIEGRGLVGRPGIARRIFESTESVDCNVVMISQASSEQSVSFVVAQADVQGLTERLHSSFELELTQGFIEKIDIVQDVAITSIIGRGMAGTPGISGRFFGSLGRVGVNVLAIAQGATEMNISVAIHEDDAARAVRAAHSAFGLTRTVHLIVFGTGRVGKYFLKLLAQTREKMQSNLDLELSLIGVVNSRQMRFDVDGLDPERVVSEGWLPEIPERPDNEQFIQRLRDHHMADVVLVDLTAADTMPLHQLALDAGFHVVTANKIPLTGASRAYQALMQASRDQGGQYGYETTFGAGLPVLHTLMELVQTGDSFDSIAGCLSGTLGHICTSLQDGLDLKGAVELATAAGYTEPDPREDLSGRDVQRKALIIARAAGLTLELDEIPCEALVPGLELGLERALEDYQPVLAKRIAKAKEQGKVLRFLAEITPHGASVGLREVAADSAIGRLCGPDNILVFRTSRYKDFPLVIQGPGAGIEVTAAGVLGDVLKIARR
jgi:bifunctional aspartokinase / homoserine dehydrogenase 1